MHPILTRTHHCVRVETNHKDLKRCQDKKECLQEEEVDASFGMDQNGTLFSMVTMLF